MGISPSLKEIVVFLSDLNRPALLESSLSIFDDFRLTYIANVLGRFLGWKNNLSGSASGVYVYLDSSVFY